MTLNPRPDIDIDISISCADWNVVDDLHTLAQSCLLSASAQYCPRSFTEISLMLTDDAHIQNLNAQYRGQDKPTNVLSFPTTDINMPMIENVVLGDIVLAFETVRHQAERQNISLEHHLSHLLIHGYLHLQGLDHQNKQDATEMEAYEIKVLAGLGICNPYDRDES